VTLTPETNKLKMAHVGSTCYDPIMQPMSENDVMRHPSVISSIGHALEADLVGLEAPMDDGSVVDALFRKRSDGKLIAIEAKRGLTMDLIGQVVSAMASGSFDFVYALVTETWRTNNYNNSRNRISVRRATASASFTGFGILCVMPDMTVSDLLLAEDVDKRERERKACRSGRGRMLREHLELLRKAKSVGYVTVDDYPDHLVTECNMKRAMLKGVTSRISIMRAAKLKRMQKYFMGGAGNNSAKRVYLRKDDSIVTRSRLRAYVLTDDGESAVACRYWVKDGDQ